MPAQIDLRAVFRRLENAAWTCGVDEMKDGTSSAAMLRHGNELNGARQDATNAVAVYESLRTENAALAAECEQLRAGWQQIKELREQWRREGVGQFGILDFDKILREMSIK